MTDIFAGIIIGWTAEQEMRFFFQNGQKGEFLFTKLSQLSHRKHLFQAVNAVTQKAFIPSRSLIRVSLNFLMVMALRYVSNW